VHLQRSIALIGLVCLLFCGSSVAWSSEHDTMHQIQRRLEAVERDNAALRQTVEKLKNGTGSLPPAAGAAPQDALDAAIRELDKPASASVAAPAQKDLFSASLGSSRLRLIEVSLDVLVAAGASTARDEELENLGGGGHDPKRRGFTLQQTELSLIGAVDPYFLAEAHIIASEDEIELEEAFLQTLALPYGLELEAGFFLTEFGRINPTHPHAWLWLDQPVVNTRLFGGEGMRGTGMRLAKLLPTPWFSQIHIGIQNADGEFMASFLGGEIGHAHGAEEEAEHEALGIGGRPIIERDVRRLKDLVYLARWENALELSSTWSGKLGISGLYGPNFTGPDGETWIYGADFFLKWLPETNRRGRPFFRFEGEFIQRDLKTDAFFDEVEGESIAGDTLKDWGFYLQGFYGFNSLWSAGLRYEYASGSGDNIEHDGEFPGRRDDPFRDDRTRVSPLLVYSPSEFSRIRLQYNYDQADHLRSDAHTVWLGFEALIGAHPAHSY
jgi:hypothetical protein